MTKQEMFNRWYTKATSYPRAMAPNGETVVGDYNNAHRAVRLLRGKASLYECVCGAQAHDWAYMVPGDHDVTDDKGRTYSLDPWSYMALCKTCHERYDHYGIFAHEWEVA